MAMEALRIAAKESPIMKFVLGAFIALAVGGLVFTDVSGSFTGGATGNTVAEVGDTTIELRQFDRGLRAYLSPQGITPDDAYGTPVFDAYLQTQIDSALLIESARTLDLSFSNAMIARQVRQIFSGMSAEQIEMTMRAQGVNEDDLANGLRDQMALGFASQVYSAVTKQMPDYLVQAAALLQQERRNGVFYNITLESMAGEDIVISDDDIADYYQANQADFTSEEKKRFVIGTMTAAQAQKDVPKLTDEDIRAAYESNKEDFFLPEQRSIEQAIIRDVDQAQAVYEAGLAGVSLQDAVKDVTGGNAAYRAASTYDRDGLPQPMAAAAFGLSVKIGEVLPPVQTPLGYAVMVVQGMTEASYQDFETIKADLKKEMQENARLDALYTKMVDVEDLLDEGMDFKTIAEKIGLTTQKTAFVSASDLNGGQETMDDLLREALAASPSLAQELTQLAEGAAAYPLELDENRFIVIGVDAVQAAETKPLDAVRDRIQDSLYASRLQAVAREKSEELLASLKDNPDQADRIFKDYKHKTSAFSNRARDNKDWRTDQVFVTAEGDFATAVKDGSVTFIHVTEIAVSDTATAADSLDADVKEAQQRIFDALTQEYLRESIGVDVNETLLRRAYGNNMP